MGDTKVGVASRCDEPAWGRECLQMFMVKDGVSMWDIADGGNLCEIYKGSKQSHFRMLQKKTGIAFKDMLFFDDDSWNIRQVEELGLTSILTPDGVTAQSWHEGLTCFSRSRE